MMLSNMRDLPSHEHASAASASAKKVQGTLKAAVDGINEDGMHQDYGHIATWDVRDVTDMSLPFSNMDSEIIADLSFWDTRQVTTMRGMFSRQPEFNGEIRSWHTRLVTDMSCMFFGARKFNRDIGGWDTENVTTMGNMFSFAESFDQNIGEWNTRNVTDMESMFSNATAFNCGNSKMDWNVRRVTNMQHMFNLATSFNQDISAWKVKAQLQYMFYGARALDFSKKQTIREKWNLRHEKAKEACLLKSTARKSFV